MQIVGLIIYISSSIARYKNENEQIAIDCTYRSNETRNVTEDIQDLYNLDANATVWCGIPETASHLMVMEMGKCVLRF